MKFTFTLLVLSLLTCITQTFAQEVYIPDANFRSYLQSNYPSCMDGNNLITNAPGLANATSIIVDNQNITDLTGVEYFTALTFLSCSNNQLTSLPSLSATSITMMYCDNNQLTAIPALPTTITRFTCSNNPITSLATLPSNLQYLYASTCQLAALPALPPNLIYIDCRYNQLTSLPALPNSLCDLIAHDGNSISCMPNRPTCSNLSTDIPNVCVATAISDPSSSAALVAYPNPFNQSVQIQLASSYTGDYTLSIYNTDGRLCETKQHVNSGEIIEMGTSLQPGVYVVKIEGDQVARMKVIKQ